jgi:peptidoglycan/xylan/chitin deacetylase (PgdA/CDA1 family)
MDLEQLQADRLARRRERAQQARRRRALTATAAGLVAVIVAVVVIATSGGGSSGSHAGANAATRSAQAAARAARRKRRAGSGFHPGSTVSGVATGKSGTTPVPVLMYHVIAPPPPGAPFPGLYVPENEFAAQMAALKAAGWHPVTLDQLEAYWTRGVPLGPGKPIVLTFDNGYHSQYADALPVLRGLHWVADENIQLSGLPPSQGGLTNAEVRALVRAGWELDTQGISHADLITLDASELHYQVATARHILQRRYGVPVNWFCYPSGHYDATVIDAVKAAGFVGSTTVVPGWAGPHSDPYRLPRLRVLNGTTPSALLDEIASIRTDPPPPASYSG